MPGTLFVVATPIGNLEDLTFRALRVLKEVDVIAAEDTRRTSKLLAHYGVSKPLVSLHQHNEYREAPRLVTRLLEGTSIALVSDAGTPGISDPGATLVGLARGAGATVTPVPGPSAITAALSVSGIPATPFTFLGFPPASGAARERWFERLRLSRDVVVFFEAPHRIAETVNDLGIDTVTRPIIAVREISKINEELVVWDNSTSPTDTDVPARGEFVVVVTANEVPPEAQEWSDIRILSVFDQISSIEDLQQEHALKAVAAITGLSQQKVMKSVKKARIAVKQGQDRSDS